MNLKRYISPNLRRFIRRILQSPEKLQFFLAASNIYRTKNHKRILDLKNKHIGKRCFIIGSGPSINKMDLSPLKNEITFGFNAFYLISESIGFLPTYYLIEDPLPAEDNANNVNRLSGTIKIFPWDLHYCLKPDSNTIYVHFDRYYSNYPHPNFPQFSDNSLKCVYWGGTVAYMALQLAYYMGIRDVYLIGIDLDYKMPNYATEDVIVSRESDASHFHPDYFGPGKRWHDPKVERMKRAFEYASEYYKRNAGVIYNATFGGKLEKFPRVDFERLFRG